MKKETNETYLELMSTDDAIGWLTLLGKAINGEHGRENGKSAIQITYQLALFKAIEALKKQQEDEANDLLHLRKK